MFLVLRHADIFLTRRVGGKRPHKGHGVPKGHRMTQGQEGDVVVLEELALHNPVLQVIW